MSHDQLSSFLQALTDDRDVVRIAEEVSADGEIAALTTRIRQARGDGPAVLFERVAGSAIPVVTNLLGSYARVCRHCEPTRSTRWLIACRRRPNLDLRAVGSIT